MSRKEKNLYPKRVDAKLLKRIGACEPVYDYIRTHYGDRGAKINPKTFVAAARDGAFPSWFWTLRSCGSNEQYADAMDLYERFITRLTEVRAHIREGVAIAKATGIVFNKKRHRKWRKKLRREGGNS